LMTRKRTRTTTRRNGAKSSIDISGEFWNYIRDGYIR
jgi:hypothetical protein